MKNTTDKVNSGHSITLKETISRNLAIRDSYHKLEDSINGKRWTIEEDALGFLTDAALIGRMAMAYEKTWPTENPDKDLEILLPHKLGECVCGSLPWPIEWAWILKKRWWILLR